MGLGVVALVGVTLWLAGPSQEQVVTRPRPAPVEEAPSPPDAPGSGFGPSSTAPAADADVDARSRGRNKRGADGADTATGAPSSTGLVTPNPVPPPVDGSGELLLASSFDLPICGQWFNPDPQCEFAVEGGTEDGSFGGRTGDRAVRIDRTSPEHMGVLSDQPLPGGGAFVGVAHRVPALPDGTIKASPGHIQIMQLSPTDGEIRGHAVEVRLYPDRRLGLALHRGDDVAIVDWPVPVDEWFYVVVQLVNGTEATQRMWVYDSDDRLAASTSIVLDNTQGGGRTAQKIGGSSPTTRPLYTYADDWYISTTFLGPARIGIDGVPILR